MKLILSAPGGLEDLVAQQSKELGCDVEHVTPGEVRVHLEDPARVYELLLWLRHASRVVLSLAEGQVDGPDALYRLVQRVDWTRHLPLVPGFRVDVFGRADWLRDDRYAARVAKDAIVDQFWDRKDERPNTGPDEPIRVEVRIHRGRATVGLNLAGEALDRRGYRLPGHPATLREGIGAALLDRARWTPETPLLDPFCGSGTLILEAAMLASGTAPGLYRDNAVEHWLRFKPDAMEAARQRALKRRRQPPREPRLWGRDIDPAFIELARAQARQLGLSDWVKFDVASVEALPEVERPDEWLVLTNPPWGKRLQTRDIQPLYEQLGQQMKAHWAGARLAVLTDRKELAQAMGLRVGRRNAVAAGPDKLQLNHYEIGLPDGHIPQSVEVSADFAARLTKRYKHLKKWAVRQQIEAYRVYDADLPEYAFIVDVYGERIHMAEYAPPKQVDPVVARRRREQALVTVAHVFEQPTDQIVFKTRAPGGEYERNETDDWMEVNEEGARYRINLTRYNDTGLFLDHRGARRFLQKQAEGKDCLNLFSYTATASVRMALGGAKKVASVDLSPRYTRWAEQNYRMNKLSTDQHPLIQADVIKWLYDAPNAIYDLVLLDPPTFSNSARTDTVWDIKKDAAVLLAEVHRVLRPGGACLFSNNARGFKLLSEVKALWGEVTPFTDKTRDQDCPLSHRSGHKSWWLTK